MSLNGYLGQPSSLGIIYAVVSRGTVILAQFASHHGNFTEVCQQVLELVPTDNDAKLTYAARDYMYHYICEDGIIYMCITDDDFERSRAFLFLENIKTKFQRMFGGKVFTAKPYAMNSEFSRVLASEMQSHSESTLSLINLDGHIQLDNIGIRNLELSGQQDLEPLELLESDNYSMRSYESANILARQTNECRQCCRKHAKSIVIFLIIVVLIVVIAFGITVGICFDTDSNKCGLT